MCGVSVAQLVDVHEKRRSKVQAPSDAVPLIFRLHCTFVFSYLFEPLNELPLIYNISIAEYVDFLNRISYTVTVLPRFNAKS